MHRLSSLKWKIRVVLSGTASFLEIVLAALLAAALAVCTVQLIPSLFELDVSVHEIDHFHDYLEAVFALVIGVEALKLLCKHTPGSALEILLFAIARGMIVNHTTPTENLLVVISIGLLFAIRKFLFVPAWGIEHEISSFDKANGVTAEQLKNHEEAE